MHERWLSLWSRLGAEGHPDRLFRHLVRRYTEEGRAYHNLAHIEDCLRQLDAAPIEADRDAIEWALWFHDAIYDTHSKDNEAQSAELALEMARVAGLREPFAQQVNALVLATRHTSPPSTPQEEWMVDIDLSILGRESQVFDQYEQQIREEYAWVPAEDFARGRAAILQSLLGRDHIFSTGHFRRLYAEKARENLSRSIADLRIY